MLLLWWLQSDVRDKQKRGCRMGKKSKAALLVSKSCYKAAFKMLWSAKGARKPMMEFLSKQLKEEVRRNFLQVDVLSFLINSWFEFLYLNNIRWLFCPVVVQMKALSRDADSPFHEKVSNRRPLLSFPWQRCLYWAQDKAPLVTTCLRSLFPDTNALSKSSQ